MEIEFIWNGGFIGDTYSFVINGNVTELDGFPSKDKAKSMIVDILKKEHNLDYTEDMIMFKWGGAL